MGHNKNKEHNPMRRRVRIIVSLVLSILLSGLSASFYPALCVEDIEEQYPTVSKKETAPPKKISTIVKKKTKKDRVQYKMNVSTSAGYDANVDLERYDEDGSIFLQDTFGIKVKCDLNEMFDLTASYNLTWIKYLKYSTPDLLDNVFSLQIDAKLNDRFLLFTEYELDVAKFPHDNISEYNMHQVTNGIRHNVSDWFYHTLSHEFFYKHYVRWKTQNSMGYMFLRDRDDIRNSIVHKTGIFMGNKTFLRTENRFYYNESNELFLDYYDYRAFKSKVSIIRLINKKLYGLANFAYQYKAYIQRGVSDHPTEDQRDHLLMGGASLFYDITPKISLGTSLDYRKNFSNENEQAYEDYVVSSGLYYSF